ncbi:fimbrial protein [Providencia stuartii]|uniref:fimbrial protein n=1 Tax=Providencia stuartii TaxID=588 RepID=UPI0028BFF888|nr:fimbrial protein [Providencia stuartii]MDT7051802.1 fimbrial protein [Providencia stuartii]
MNNLLKYILLILFFNHSISFSADGEIKFVGSIIPTACSVDTNSVHKVVNMGKVSVAAFTNKNSAAAATPFRITLSNCPTDYKKIQFKFDGKSDSANPSLLGLSPNATSPAATGIAIGLYEENSVRRIPLNGGSQFKEITPSKTVEMNFVAKYIATSDQIIPGSADALAHFSIIYQ